MKGCKKKKKSFYLNLLVNGSQYGLLVVTPELWYTGEDVLISFSFVLLITKNISGFDLNKPP